MALGLRSCEALPGTVVILADFGGIPDKFENPIMIINEKHKHFATVKKQSSNFAQRHKVTGIKESKLLVLLRRCQFPSGASGGLDFD
jgi:hypothetical protein